MSSADRAGRWLWGCIATAGSAVLMLAAALEPDPSGFGTHTQLGLPPCGFLAMTGLPCPGCGLTTAFAYAVRGQWLAALSSNVLGLPLFVAVCAAIPISLLAALRGWSFGFVVDRLSLDRMGLALAACGVLQWAARFAGV